MSEREELRREFSFENAIPNGPWYTFDTEKALDEIATLRTQLADVEAAMHGYRKASETAERALDKARREREARIRDIEQLIAPVEVGGGVKAFLAEAEALRHRAERMERVVEAAKALEAYYGKHYDYRVKARRDVLALEPRIVALIEAVRALDATRTGDA